ncbi:MAG: hypothetical protein GX541_04290, partial [Clostridiales bacterium]|nr:hypothetical protein [Clostridiales bacterium]
YVSDAIAQLGEVDVEVPGEYVITFESVSAGDKQIFVSSIILDGTAQDAVLQSVSVDCAKPGLLVGQSAPLSVTAHLSDGSLITGTPPSVSLLGRSITMNAESLSPNIFSVDGTGMLTALAPGEGQVKGGASMGGVSLYSTIQISAAKAPIYSGYIETYSFKNSFYQGDTQNDTDARLSPYTDYTEHRPWAHVADSMPAGPSRAGGNLFGANILAVGMQAGRSAYSTSVQNDWIALKFKAPRTGRYEATVEYVGMKNNGIVDVHILPLSRVDLSDIAGSINEETKVGRFDGYNINEVFYYKSVLGNVVFPVDGDYLLIFKQAGKNPDATGCAMYITSLTFDGVTPGELASITVSTESGVSEIEPGATAKIKYRAYSVGGPEIDLEDEGIVPEIINRTPEIISVDENGIVTAKKIGIAEIDVSVFLDGVSIVGSLNLYVTDFSDVLSVELNAPPFVPVRGKAQLKQSAAVASGNTIPVPQSAMSYIIVSAEPEGAATVDGNGLITGVKEGFVRIKGIANYRGRTWETPVVTVPVEIRTKTRSTIYTPEKRANVQENVKKYAWAKSEVDAVVRDADKYVDNAETLWNNVVAEGLPRFYHNGEALDPEQGLCRYCKFNISAKYGNYPYLYNALSNPWKIQCPECKRRFPSNDFGKYYKSGLDEHGVFKPDLADRSLLTNDLYPEMDTKLGVTGWGVDDGFGYYPGNTYSNGVVERHNHIAYYIHEGLYGVIGGYGLIPRALNSLSLAYVYTGEARYGRTGAILLDRVADFYPDFDWCMWQDYLPHTYRGKNLYNTWENNLVQIFAKAYDAFYPVYDDPQVISFLRNKAERYGIENPKDSAYALRFNVEDNILREIYKACLESNLVGNFGMRQLSLTLAAVALDSSPETGEWLNWVMHPGEATTTGKPDPSSLSTGGDVMHTLINKVTRDGMGNESSPGYNTIWLESLMEIAELLHDYDKYTNWDLYNNPKFTKMFTSHIPLTLAGYYTAQIGDHSGTAGGKISVNDLFDTYVKGFARLGNPELAQILYHGNGDSVEGIHLGIMEKDPERIQQDILDVIDKYGTFSPRSDMLAGYGFAVLRDGKKYKSTGSQEVNTLRDFWMYFGTGSYHGHDDALNLGIDAYGLNMAPDLGYPEYAGTDPNRIQWVDASLSHNTVMVNGKSQTPIAYSSTPLHFDDSGRVKVMDADASQVYSYTDIYRRTVVMVKVSDEVSYGVDFFRVRGGNDHVYSFHSQSGEIDKTEGLDGLTAQNGGTYAGPDVPFGQDPKTNPNSYSKDYLLYPPGSTWLENVRRDTAPAPKFSIDFKVTDFRKLLPAHLTRDLHLRMTMLNDNPLSEVAIATGYPPKANRKWIDHLEYVLVRNTGSGNLDTLFTTVFEPYRGERYLADMSAVDMNVESGVPGDKDTARAVKVTHKNGRVDYIVYASNNTVEYLVDNKFGFKGFVGVYTLYDGEPVYSYINDGNKIGGFSGLTPAYTGQVLDFTRELSMNNSITIQPDGEIDLSKLPGRFIYVDNESSPENGAYEIVGAKETGDGIVIDIGDVSPIRAYKNKDSLASKFVYNIESGQSFRIPLPAVYDTSPVFKKIGRKTVDVGSEIRFTVEAESPA